MKGVIHKDPIDEYTDARIHRNTASLTAEVNVTSVKCYLFGIGDNHRIMIYMSELPAETLSIVLPLVVSGGI